MDTISAKVCKVQVVYYLNRAGKMEPPHMIEVQCSSPYGLRLKDVKKRLNFLRGSGMSNLFSWSYKTNYRSKYIWQDLSDNDVIDPGNGNEYVLKGSEILDDYQGKYFKPFVNQVSESRRHTEVQSKYRGAEIWLKSENRKVAAYDTNICSESKIEIEEKISSQGKNSSCFSGTEYSGKNQSSTDCKISSSTEDSVASQFHDIRVYKIKPISRSADYSCDAATQTERNLRRASKNEIPAQSSQSAGHSTELKKAVFPEEENLHLHVTASPSYNTMVRKFEFVQNKDQQKTSNLSKESLSSLKFKQTPSSWLFLHILSCGNVDTKLQYMIPNTETKKSNDRELDARSSSEAQELAAAQASPSQEGDVYKLISRSSSFSSRRSAISVDLEIKPEKKLKDIGSLRCFENKRHSHKTGAQKLSTGSKDIGVSTANVKSDYRNSVCYVPWLHQYKEAGCIEYRTCV